MPQGTQLRCRIKGKINGIRHHRFDKLVKSHDEEKGIFKAFCKSSQDRLKILMKGEFVLETEKLKYNINTKPLVWPLEACRRCHKFTIIHQKLNNVHKCADSDPLTCAKCNSISHKTNECQEKTPQCINCGGNGHSSTDKHQCLQYTRWEEKTLTDKLNNLLESARHCRLSSNEGYKKGRLNLHGYAINALELNNNSTKKSIYGASSQYHQTHHLQTSANSYSSRTSSAMDTLSDRIRVLERDIHQSRSTSSVSNSSNFSLASNSCSQKDSIMTWTKGEFIQNINQSTQNTINETLMNYRSFHLEELDHILDERDHFLEKRVLEKIKLNNFMPQAPPQSEYNKQKYDDYFQNKVLKSAVAISQGIKVLSQIVMVGLKKKNFNFK